MALQFTENRHRNTGLSFTPRQRNVGLSVRSNPRAVITTVGARGPQGDAGVVQSVGAGDHIGVDDSDPANPIVTAGGFAVADISGLVAGLALKADLASPALTGNPTAPTQSPGDNDTSIATTAFVAAALDALEIPLSTATPLLAQSLGWALEEPGDVLTGTTNNGHGCRAGFGSVWVGTTSDSAGTGGTVGVLRIEVDGTLTTLVTVGTFPTHEIRGIAVSITHNRVAAADKAAGTVVLINPDTNAIVATITGLTAARGICFDGDDFMYVTLSPGSGNGSLIKLDITGISGTVAASTIDVWTTTVSELPFYPGWDGVNHIYVPSFTTGNVKRVHKTTGTVTTTITTVDSDTIDEPYECFAAGPWMYWTNHGSGMLHKYPIGSNGTAEAFAIGSGGNEIAGFTIVGSVLYGCRAGAAQIVMADVNHQQVLGAIPCGDHPPMICYLPPYIFHANSLDQDVQRHLIDARY